MKVIGIIVCILIFLYIAEVDITMKPYSITLPAWRIAVGYTLIVLGMAYVINHHKRIARKEGKVEGIQFQINQIEEARKKISKDSARIMAMDKQLSNREENITVYANALASELDSYKPKQN